MNTKPEHVFAVIPARAGSKGLPGKNVRPLCGKPLIAWTIEAAQKSTELTAAWVSTEDQALADVARRHGGEVPVMRPAALATDEASIFEVMKHLTSAYEAKAGRAVDIVVLLQPTSPLRVPAHIDETVRLIKAGADSAQTVTVDPLHPRHRFTLEDGRLKPFFSDADKHSRRQDGEAVYRPNGAVYAARRDVLFTRNLLRGDDHRAVVMDFESSVDIDSLWDFKLAELILAERQAARR